MQCIYRRPNECKEHYKLLTDKSSGDGADSADDSGSSQPFTLPGIPKVYSLTLRFVVFNTSAYIWLCLKAIIWSA